ncbi:hypothetical protein QFZ62_001462 [Clavibacter sp. B3I6]|uniref:hypothetical protein n=1 Tax=Clavibacter sp. B3I6 TaxID=3042268 RepID=UPI002780D35F|nr:hypothetical protein [Clavibacter sp. B3I6]MDQ0744154.1 hypothetical protein [Clavibacter sp. B3I6]
MTPSPRTPRRTGLGLGVVLCLAALSACTTPDEASTLDRYSTSSTPAPADVVAQVEVGGITVTWPQEPRDLLITSVGSSSCPRVPVELRGDASRTLVIAEDTGSGSACSADLGPTTSRIERPDAWTPGAVVTADHDGDVLLLTVE